ncbi:MAG TPA: SDR family oxidoreductase [Victivallales bacterium]|nr:SDR family oxidoreductase [Victivallales bacterium]HPO90280.1 SDR family oxidoreductase [Victivallales bacterium]HRR06003.1 SDR family oxidoreductase [Victivallales bacterium]HRR28554.1 SDR family oxidoreductase [Victivallales bacterium]HRU00594.1 SDR family oxidoreductase [Victivallales bacterium]
MKVLITGSTGLLGSEIKQKLISKNFIIIGIARSPKDNFEIKADLTNEKDILKIAELDFDCIIHTAAWRNPEQCEKDKNYCYKINVNATEALAKIARDKNAFFFHISTDYVFSGENPPYYEYSQPSPVNYYGETKAQAEEIVKQVSKNIILRVPLLYGTAAGVKNSAVLQNMISALKSNREWPMEDSIVRFPTYTGDVAEVILFLINKRETGIFHFSGQDKTTRYKMTLDFAEVMEMNPKNIIRLPEPPPSEVRRPLNSQLSIEKILSKGFSLPLPFKERLKIMKKQILTEFKNL